ncbi:hypothetical protein E3P99_03377 [Wallemia hederae]|uniref:Uncharacterized protein n=1 Tax=Wallemia hederae TaxID=1540922 RepID=A0A4T0FGD7_9BASI|nr:hypothetical protein E3P99_03377 [Wallemia hederae]
MKISTLATLLAAGTAVNAVPVQHEARELTDVLQGLIDQAGKANPTKDPASTNTSAQAQDDVLESGLDKLKRAASDAIDEGGRLDEALDQLKKRAVLNDYLSELLTMAEPGNVFKRQDDIQAKINETLSNAIDDSITKVTDELAPSKRQADLPIVGPVLEKLLGGGSAPAAPSAKRQADLPIVGPVLEKLLGGGASATPAPAAAKRQLEEATEMLGDAPILGGVVKELTGAKEEEEEPTNPLDKIKQLNSREVYKFWETNGDSFLADVHRLGTDAHVDFDHFNHDGHHHKDAHRRQSEGGDAETAAETALDGEALSGLDKGLDALKKRQLKAVSDAAGDLPLVGDLVKPENKTESAAPEAQAADADDKSSSLTDMLPLKARQLIPSPPDLGGVLEGGSPSANPDAKGLDKLKRLLEEEKPDPVGSLFDGLQGTVKEISDTVPGNGGTAETFFEKRQDDTDSSSDGIPNILKSLQTMEKTEEKNSTTSSSEPAPTGSSDPNILDDLTNTSAIKNGLNSAIDMIPE